MLTFYERIDPNFEECSYYFERIFSFPGIDRKTKNDLITTIDQHLFQLQDFSGVFRSSINHSCKKIVYAKLFTFMAELGCRAFDGYGVIEDILANVIEKFYSEFPSIFWNFPYKVQAFIYLAAWGHLDFHRYK